ncbi:MAG: hypothetical protein AAFX04_05250 [Pseudomonadota bacterium]
MRNFFAVSAVALAASLAAAPAVAQDDYPPATIDTNGDGVADAWDRDGDGQPDAWDTDADGKPDLFEQDGQQGSDDD